MMTLIAVLLGLIIVVWVLAKTTPRELVGLLIVLGIAAVVIAPIVLVAS
jgi:hypothetical protein